MFLEPKSALNLYFSAYPLYPLHWKGKKETERWSFVSGVVVQRAWDCPVMWPLYEGEWVLW
jgi:hypothetical protein